ncbi:MAG: hypothetical protein JOZ69_11400 [Myxococcales bacterium]|nr:hypothetical protein [Myxococcales bacterium]
MLRNRPESLVRIYESIEAFARSLGSVEIVTRERYALFRSVRIFADLVVMTDAVRLVVHLRRRVDDPLFIKIVSKDKVVSHVAKLTRAQDWQAVKPYMKEAYDLSVS